MQNKLNVWKVWGAKRKNGCVFGSEGWEGAEELPRKQEPGRSQS